MTLTTEQYTEGLCGDGAAILCDGVPMSVSEILAALNAANREAQPVALVDRRPAASGSICWQNGGKDLPHGTELFTTPPAYAQPAGYFVRHRSVWDKEIMWKPWTECSGEDYAEYCKRIATGEADAGRFYETRILYDAPPVPQSTNSADWGINMQTGTPILTYKNCSVIEQEQAHYVLSLINGSATPAPAPAVQDEIDSFADQVIGTKNKIIRLPAPLYVPHEGIKVYLDADALLSCIERQGIFVLLDSI